MSNKTDKIARATAKKAAIAKAAETRQVCKAVKPVVPAWAPPARPTGKCHSESGSLDLAMTADRAKHFDPDAFCYTYVEMGSGIERFAAVFIAHGPGFEQAGPAVGVYAEQGYLYVVGWDHCHERVGFGPDGSKWVAWVATPDNVRRALEWARRQIVLITQNCLDEMDEDSDEAAERRDIEPQVRSAAQ